MPDEQLLARLPATAWPGVPIIAFGGIALHVILASAGLVSPDLLWTDTGVWGCVAGSVLLALISYQRPQKDLVSLLTPLYALIIFNPFSDFPNNLTLKILYAATITALSYRLEHRFKPAPAE
ncbi:MAG: hypothetical protein GKC04_00235 [Methanomicrobiales archaeon]|nr:hypothetical protein [Methanomicrobiales archaeon]